MWRSMSEENIALLWLLGIPLPRFAGKRNFVPPRAANWHGQANHFCFSEIDVNPGDQKYSAFVLTQISRITPPVYGG